MSTSHLIAMTFDRADGARQQLDELYQLEKRDLVALEDAVVMEISANGKPTIHRAEDLAEVTLAKNAFLGGALGTLVGALALNPVVGGVLGLSIGSMSAVVGTALLDVGISDEFLGELASHLKPGGSALFIMGTSDQPSLAMHEMKPSGGQIISTTLDPEETERLQKALSGKIEPLTN